MTDPLNEISRVKETDRNSTRGEIFKREKRKKHPMEEDDDNVDISEEARNRASDKKSGNTL